MEGSSLLPSPASTFSLAQSLQGRCDRGIDTVQSLHCCIALSKYTMSACSAPLCTIAAALPCPALRLALPPPPQRPKPVRCR